MISKLLQLSTINFSKEINNQLHYSILIKEWIIKCNDEK